jgi:hypothetical protein
MLRSLMGPAPHVLLQLQLLLGEKQLQLAAPDPASAAVAAAAVVAGLAGGPLRPHVALAAAWPAF